MNDITNRQDPESRYFCQVDTHRATKDYLGNGRCVRLLGVVQSEFSDRAIEEGVTTFTIDIDYWKFCTLILSLNSWRDVHAQHCAAIDGRDDDTDIMSSWYVLEVDFNARDGGYLYETFSDARPRFFGILSIGTIESGPIIPAVHKLNRGKPSWSLKGSVALSRLPGDDRSLKIREANSYFFESFHVGQGMCSLVHDGYAGALLDVGAGKPVTRNAYLARSIRNDLATTVAGLTRLCAVISHADSDHWRVLSWDSILRSKIDHIYVPVGAKSLALRDRALMNKVVGIASQTWNLNNTSRLRLLRSSPHHADSNGDCLIAVFEREADQVLAAGDYVYERFSSDMNASVAALTNAIFSGVVVPHHGDAASANAIVCANSQAKAFFSAGTHQGYGHPTAASLAAHQSARYTILSNPTQVNIVRTRLL